MSNIIDPTRIFTSEEVKTKLTAVIGKTLLEADRAKLFDLYEGKEKVTGIAGQIIECSVLGCKLDSKQEPDILIDDVLHEIKTTGMVKPKSNDSLYTYECKEPVSVTAVSIPVIVNEEFENSSFWHKLAHMLWVYYFYNSQTTVKLEGYKNFPILGFQIFVFDDTDKLRLKHDWLLVRDFLISIHRDYPTIEERKKHYPRLSSELRGVLLVIDTAPKYPNPPRFRLKRDFATQVAGLLFSKEKKTSLQKLARPIMDYTEIDSKCDELNRLYSGRTFAEIAELLGVSIALPKSSANHKTTKTDSNEVPLKNFAEYVVLRMFDSKATSLNEIEDFVKLGVIAKSLPLMPSGKPKESMKLFTPNFSEWMEETDFEDSFLFNYFTEHQFLFIVYQYDNGIRFKGFKRVVIPDEFIYDDVKKCWLEVRSLIKEKRLRIIKSFKKDGTPIINKSGEQREAPNFPKEKHYNVFLRGSAKESIERLKTLELNGLKMIPQEIWLSKKITLSLYKNNGIDYVNNSK